MIRNADSYVSEKPVITTRKKKYKYGTEQMEMASG